MNWIYLDFLVFIVFLLRIYVNININYIDSVSICVIKFYFKLRKKKKGNEYNWKIY